MTAVVEVTLIRPGVSANGNRYPAALLRESATQWEGVTAFVDHPKGEPFPLGPSGGTPVRVTVDEQGGSVLLKEGRQMHSRSRLRLATLKACDCHNHDHLT